MSQNSSTGTTYTSTYIDGEILLNKRDIYKKIFNRYREDEGIADMLLNLGKKRVTDNTVFNHFEHDFLINEAVIEEARGTLPTAPGEPLTVLITDDSHQEGGTKSPLIEGDLVQVLGIKSLVVSVNKAAVGDHEYTIKPVDSDPVTGDDFTPLLGSLPNAPMNWYGNAFADGTFHPESKARKPIEQNNVTQIFKTKYETHGSVAANKSEVEIKGKPFYYLQGVEDALDRQMLAVNYSLTLGKRSSSLTDDTAPDGPGVVNTTEGLEESIRTKGINQIYPSWTYAEFEKMTRSLDGQRAPGEYCAMLGTDLHLDHENELHDRQINTGIDYTMFNKKTVGGRSMKGTEGRAVSFGFDSYRMGGRTMHTKKWDALNYRPVTGFTDSPYLGMGFWMPMNTVKDAKNGKGLYTVLLRYKQNDMGSRFMKEFRRGQDITGKDAVEFNHQSEVGLQLAMVNQFVRTVSV